MDYGLYGDEEKMKTSYTCRTLWRWDRRQSLHVGKKYYKMLSFWARMRPQNSIQQQNQEDEWLRMQYG